MKPNAPATKFDGGKLPFELIAPEFLEEIAQVLDFGAKKYAKRNWEGGMAWGRVFGALQRHLWAWWKGVDKDPETGFSHLAHAACCVMFLVAYERRKVGTDDRPGESNGRPTTEDPKGSQNQLLSLPLRVSDDVPTPEGHSISRFGL